MSREPPLFVIALSRKNEDRCTIALVDTEEQYAIFNTRQGYGCR